MEWLSGLKTRWHVLNPLRKPSTKINNLVVTKLNFLGGKLDRIFQLPTWQFGNLKADEITGKRDIFANHLYRLSSNYLHIT